MSGGLISETSLQYIVYLFWALLLHSDLNELVLTSVRVHSVKSVLFSHLSICVLVNFHVLNRQAEDNEENVALAKI